MRIAGLFCIFLILGSAGCGQGTEAPPSVKGVSGQPTAAPDATPPAEPTPILPSIASLEGEWRVAGIDGRSLDEPYGIALSGNPKELWWEPRCAGLARSYTIAGTKIAFGPIALAREPPAAGSPPPPVCAIAVPPRLTDVARALDAATSVGRTPANGVLISGGGHSVTLFSQ